MDTTDILLAGEERTAQLIDNMFSSVSQSFSSRKINIGMDEAFLLGRGNYFKKNGYRPQSEIFIRHLEHVRATAGKYGFNIEMWADMFRFGALIQRIKSCRDRLEAFINGTADSIAELEEDNSLWDFADDRRIIMQSWSELVTADII